MSTPTSPGGWFSAEAAHDRPGVGAAAVVVLALGRWAGLELVDAVHLGQRLVGGGHGVDGPGEAGVAAELDEDLLDLGAAQAVVDAAPHVAAQLVELVERGQDRDDDQAALAAGQPGRVHTSPRAKSTTKEPSGPRRASVSATAASASMPPPRSVLCTSLPASRRSAWVFLGMGPLLVRWPAATCGHVRCRPAGRPRSRATCSRRIGAGLNGGSCRARVWYTFSTRGGP